MKEISEKYSNQFLIIFSILVLAGVFLASEGLFNIDEFIYVSAVDAFASRGALVVENGFGEFGSTNLRLWFLVDGPNGLAPQYPIGTAISGAPFYTLFDGPRGIIFLNALAGVGSLWLTYLLARRLFDDTRVALLGVILLGAGSFWSEYVYGIWPHSLSLFAALLSLYCGVYAILERERALLWAVASGVSVGLGFLVRADAMLVLPTLGVVSLFFSDRPWRLMAAGGAGLLPALVVSALVNHYKFGTWNPLSYGTSGGGGTDPATHLPVLLLAAGVFVVLLAIRYGKLSLRGHGRKPLLMTLGAFVLACLIPETRNLLMKFASGGYALLVDAGAIQDSRPGVQQGEDGVLYFWGFVKKAFGQSMPWLGLLAALVVLPWNRHRFAYAFILTASVFWILPYVFLAWHGGLGSNMRYFLPILPLGAIAVAKIWVDCT